ncbi:GNAT family N-acetyltransferase [Aeromonas simiae]|uniref:GNAT family N-acetyltransferase n=1 Tax=Aeromonas simiae TaxID=218936 RepID=UPI00266D7BC5|nr:GNAT family N-acetyltransferase [Aeromonas simiae]MDO2947037.1 GNAT family N-acetyltransferase [Aeromonas simiae]MDO2950649.1 GNAT family N-acetyltransferase [Aeromonas simiae]MDO2954369.1 GNAT family N-acetyltransferase [Aeromonas simiae]
MQAVTLRMARPQDAAAMTQLQRASWLGVYASVLGNDLLEQMSEAEHEQVWQRRLEEGARPMLVCVDEVPVGLLYWQQEGTQAWIRALYLHPAHWRQGLGQRLWHTVALQMRRAGCDAVHLWLLAGNRIGAGFYFRQGFRPTGERRTLVSLGHDCVQHRLARSL